MILTDYYKFIRTATKSKTRLDCIASTRSYPSLESKRAVKFSKQTATRDAINRGCLVAYYGDVPDRFGGNAQRKADKSLTIKGENVSSVYRPNPKNDFAFGDFKGTSDAMLFVFKDMETVNGEIQAGAEVEIFIARGKSKDKMALYNLLDGGELDDDMDKLREQARLFGGLTDDEAENENSL